MYLCRKFTTKGLKSIGDVFGGKDHSTVLSNINKVDKRIESDPEYAETIDVIIKKLSPHANVIYMWMNVCTIVMKC